MSHAAPPSIRGLTNKSGVKTPPPAQSPIRAHTILGRWCEWYIRPRVSDLIQCRSASKIGYSGRVMGDYLLLLLFIITVVMLLLLLLLLLLAVCYLCYMCYVVRVQLLSLLLRTAAACALCPLRLSFFSSDPHLSTRMCFSQRGPTPMVPS